MALTHHLGTKEAGGIRPLLSVSCWRVITALVCAVLSTGVTVRAGLASGTISSPHITWSSCPKTAGYLCGTLQVPVVYGNSSRGSIPLSVIEHPVPQSHGIIVFNPGGPGESGVLILPILASLMPEAVRNQFTLVSFDERGTGSSEPLACGPSPAEAGSAISGTLAAARTFAGLDHACRSKYPHLFSTVDTTNSARDMDSLRLALGVNRINYYGLSYGTVLGSVYRQLYPSHVRSMVLDGPVDANLSLSADAALQAPALRRALINALDGCATTPGCTLGPDALNSYEQLLTRLSQHPLPPPGNGDDVPVTAGDLMTATLLYLSAPSFTPGFFPALQAASYGDGAPLRSVALGLETDLNGSTLVGALWAITCNDATGHPSSTATASLARRLEARFPLGGAEAVANNLIGCPGWTNRTGSVAHLLALRTQPPLVIGNTGDPNTPYAAAHLLARTVGGRVTTYVGQGHSWLLNGSSSVCMQSVVSDYLVRGSFPAPNTRCVG